MSIYPKCVTSINLKIQMTFHQNGLIKYLTFDLLASSKITHAIFTRQGGVSPAPFDALNVGGYIGDKLEHTYLNRLRSFQAVGRDPDTVYDVWQVGGADVVCTENPRPKNATHKKADAILTDNPKVTLFMRFADCVPLLLYDPGKEVVGLAHAGWQGTVKKIASAAVAKMETEYGCHPPDILAVIGPSIAPHHYQVGQDVIDMVETTFGEKASDILVLQNGNVHFDLWSANQLLLMEAGVNQVEISGYCTACHPKDWFSHRGEKGKTGRFGALIALNG